MWLQRFGRRCLSQDAVCHTTCVLASLAAALGVPFASWISCLLVALVTLVKGRTSGFITLVWAITPVLALFLAWRIDIREILLFQLILVWVLALVWRRPDMNAARLLGLTLLGGVVVVTAFHLIISMGTIVFWKHGLQQYFASLAQQTQPQGQAKEVLNGLLPFMTGIVVASLLLGGLLALLGGYLWQRLLQNAPPSRQFIGVRLGRLTLLMPSVLLLVSGLFWLLHHYGSMAWLAASWPVYWSWLQDIIPIVLVLYGLVGLSQFHAFFPAGHRYRWVLYVAYALLLAFPGYMLGFLVLVVLTDGCWRRCVPLGAH